VLVLAPIIAKCGKQCASLNFASLKHVAGPTYRACPLKCSYQVSLRPDFHATFAALNRKNAIATLTTPGQKSRHPSLLLFNSSSDNDDASTTTAAALVLILGNPSGVCLTTTTTLSFFATIGVRSSIIIVLSLFWKLLNNDDAAPSLVLGLPLPPAPPREDNKDDVVEDAMVEGVRELRMRSSRGMSRDHIWWSVFSSSLSLSRALCIARACVTFEISL